MWSLLGVTKWSSTRVKPVRCQRRTSKVIAAVMLTTDTSSLTFGRFLNSHRWNDLETQSRSSATALFDRPVTTHHLRYFLVPFGLPSRILNLYRTKSALAFVCFSFLFLYLFLFLVTCARLSWPHSAFQSTLNSSTESYRIVLTIGD